MRGGFIKHNVNIYKYIFNFLLVFNFNIYIIEQ